jgi:hypothetical protein
MIDAATQLNHALQAVPAHDKGAAIAQACNWCGDDIFAIMLDALTDANFHTEAAAIRNTWERVAELKNLIEGEGCEEQAAAYAHELNQLKGA